MTQQKEFYEGSGNVFADLGLPDAEEIYARAKIGFEVWKILQERELKQNEISELLGISESDVSWLINCQFNRFSTEKLIIFLKRLDREVILMIERKSPVDNQQGICLSL